eukprot:CAMPEP_0118951098 /NCGR_PEP_ID=MMETSP1169-20130426/52530_1 /TAXON_ID=36882 /ORGANISM="Pyramimonas obovata, Strain CCMP722" /LENGTH=44 /DNA_ID= /DNA_START= /DNA_END= /DNA_ORIENTATION=
MVEPEAIDLGRDKGDATDGLEPPGGLVGGLGGLAEDVVLRRVQG